jgi:di/tricarboxylate transporter
LPRAASANEARRSLDLPVLVTIAASFALGNALEKTGAAKFLAMASWLCRGEPPGCCSRWSTSA